MRVFTHTLSALAGACLMYAAVQHPVEPLGIQPGPISSVSQPGMAGCELEDGSGPDQILPCRWDAATDGNQRGYSFVVTKNAQGYLCYTYDNPKAELKWGGCSDTES